MEAKTASSIIKDMMDDTARKSFHENKWGQRHVRAFNIPVNKAETGIVALVSGLASYCDAMKEMGYKASEDYVLGVHVLDIAKGIHGLLNGDTGRLDCGVMSGLIDTILKNEGYEEGINTILDEA